jgi:putative ABC transport system permease protein
MYLLRLALKNAMRKPARTLITALSVVVGVMMIVLAWAFIDGLDQSVIRGQIHSDSGHLRIVRAGYLEVEEQGELDLLVDTAPGTAHAVQRLLPDARLHQRISFTAELSDGRHGLSARGVAVEPESYFADFTLPLESRLEAEDQSGLEPMWLGAELARAFGTRPGEILTVLTRTRHGSYTAEDFLVHGLVRSQNPAIDNMVFFLPLAAARNLLDAPDTATEIVGFLPHQDQAPGAAARLGPELAARGLELQTWLEKAEPLLRINRLRRRIFAIVVGIIVLIAATGIANTVVMSGFERVQEIGTLRALGFQVETVAALLLTEALFVGLLGSAAGAAAGAGVVHALRDGLDFSQFTSEGNYSASIASVIYLVQDWTRLAAAFAVGMTVTVASAVYPALRFSRLSPAEAMRR